MLEGRELSMIDKCPICGIEANKEVTRYKTFDMYSYKCKSCGEYKATELAVDKLKDICEEDKAKLSSVLKYRQLQGYEKIHIYLDKTKDENYIENHVLSLENLIKMFPSHYDDRVNMALKNIAKLSRFGGEFIKVDKNDRNIFICDSPDVNSSYFIIKYLCDLNLIEEEKQDGCYYPKKIRLTTVGWNKYFELDRKVSESNNAFVAMSFDASLNDIYNNGIKRAIIDAGYNPIRVDAKEYNSKICDEIISSIREAKFIISDVTQQKNGVYFEAGFSMGLGKQVIWMCRKDDVANLHFDTRQYNHIVWEDENDIYEKLLLRIKATII